MLSNIFKTAFALLFGIYAINSAIIAMHNFCLQWYYKDNGKRVSLQQNEQKIKETSGVSFIFV